VTTFTDSTKSARSSARVSRERVSSLRAEMSSGLGLGLGVGVSGEEVLGVWVGASGSAGRM